jgi:hypothetical protein
MTGPASEIGYGRAGPGFLSNAGQQRPVQWLAGELVPEPRQVFLGHGVVTLPGPVVPRGSAHNG